MQEDDTRSQIGDDQGGGSTHHRRSLSRGRTTGRTDTDARMVSGGLGECGYRVEVEFLEVLGEGRTVKEGRSRTG